MMWANEISSLLQAVLKPEFARGAVILFVVAVGSAAVSLRLAGGAFGLKFVNWSRVLVLCAVGFILSVVSATAIRLYALSDSPSQALAIGLQAGVVIIVLLAVVVPLACWLLKGSYIESLMAVASAVVAAALITLVVRAACQAVIAGGSGMRDAKERRDQVEDSITGDL